MNDTFDWTNGIVAIYGEESQPVGTGFVVSAEGLIATCAHVLDQAGWDFQDWDAPVQIRFKATKGFATARVLEGCYKAVSEGDVAFLALQEPLPARVEALQLTEARAAIGHKVSTWGYPKFRDQGLGGSGEVVALIPGDWGELIQFDSSNTTRGYSGGPVWDALLGRVIGITSEALTAGDALGRHESTNTAVPAEALVDLCPERLALTPPDEPLSDEDRLALEAYLDVVVRSSNRLPMAPLDPGGQDSAYISLSQVYVGLDAGEDTSFGDEGDTAIRYAAAVAHIYNNRRLILLGDPGSGKTTLLRFLSLCFAQSLKAPDDGWLERLSWTQRVSKISPASARMVPGDLQSLLQRRERGASEDQQARWPSGAPVPFFVSLAEFASQAFQPDEPLAIWEYVAGRLEHLGLAEAIEPLRRRALAGKVIFLLDGVDEVPLDKQRAIWQAIAAMEDGFCGRNRWLATCRVLSFMAEEAPASVPHRTLSPLNGFQIAAFIEAWYAALADSGELGREQAEGMANALKAATERPRLRALAENPMLLTIMALVQTYHGALPDERARLYQACVETLLLRWQRHKERTAEGELLPEPLVDLGTQEDLQRLLWEIAWTAHSETLDEEATANIPESQVMVIARRQLGSYARAEAFLTYTEQRAHLLIGRGGKEERVYAFPHRTFQEYLAACHLASGRRFPRQAAELAEEPGLWRETLNLVAGTLVFNRSNRERALDGVEGVLPRRTPEAEDEAGWNRVWMAGEMMAVIGRAAAEKDEVGREILPRLREQLVALLEGGRLAPVARAEAGDALGRIGDPRPGVCTRLPEMIPIPAGSFLMGSDRERDPDSRENERPQHEVALPAFAIARYPVTNAQFRFFVEDGGYTEKWRDCWPVQGWGQCQQKGWVAPRFWDDAIRVLDNKPVVGVSWYEAVAYADWLSRIEGQRFALPSEAQWERAARHTDGRMYPWGDSWQWGIVNSREAGAGRTMAVGSFPGGAAECGAQDMSGNVWEWTNSLYKDYPYDAGDGREDLAARGTRMLRGAAYFNGKIRCGARYWRRPHYRDSYFGFRLVAPIGFGS